MPSGSGGGYEAGPYETASYKAGSLRPGSFRADWLSQFGGGDRGDAAPTSTQADHLAPLKIAIVALVAMVLLGPLMTIEDGLAAGEGSVARQIGYLMILALTIYAVRPVARGASWIAFPWPVLVAFAWCWISLSWALDPGVAVRRVFLTTLVGWMAFSLVRHGGYQLNAQILRYALLASVLISYLFVFIDPSVGIHPASEAGNSLTGDMWRGFLGHKNFAGAVAALCVVMFTFDAKQVRRAVRIFAIVASVYFLWRSQSKTSAGMLVLALMGGAVFEFVNRRLRAYLIPLMTIGAAAILYLLTAYKDVLQADLTSPKAFTGRGHIWSTLLSYASEHPLGAGFGSFWNIEAGSPVFQYGQGFVTTIFVGHSGYLDQLVTVGLPGVLLMVFAMAVWPLARLLVSEQAPKGQGALISAMLMFCIGHNTTETGMFERDAIVSTIFFFAVAFAHYATLGERRTVKKDAGDAVMRELRQRKRRSARPVVTAGK
jgi:O-antigen ligase